VGQPSRQLDHILNYFLSGCGTHSHIKTITCRLLWAYLKIWCWGEYLGTGWMKCHDEFNELYTLHQMLLGQSIREEWDGSVLACLWGKTCMQNYSWKTSKYAHNEQLSLELCRPVTNKDCSSYRFSCIQNEKY
jgi:hypothetical protein